MRLRLLAPPQRTGEVVPGGGERGHAHHGREVVVPLEPERAPEHALGLRVVAGVGRHARLLHVREAERRERLPVGRERAQPRLQVLDRLIERAADRGREQRVRGARWSPATRRRLAVAGRAEQPDAAGTRTRRRRARPCRRPEPPASCPSLLVAPSWVRGPARRAGPRSRIRSISCAVTCPTRRTGRPRTGRRSGTERRSRPRRRRSCPPAPGGPATARRAPRAARRR